MAIAQVHVRSWQVGYAGLLDADDLEALRPEARATDYRLDGEPPRTYVAEIDSPAIAGFVTVDPSAIPGRIRALYVHPDHWRSGVGSALMQRALDELVRADHAVAELWVLQGNNRAERFYDAHGWMPTGRFRREVVWGMTVGEREYRMNIGDN
ncbi:GNAT family N-acetyltransferase [Tsukamurella soli]